MLVLALSFFAQKFGHIYNKFIKRPCKMGFLLLPAFEFSTVFDEFSIPFMLLFIIYSKYMNNFYIFC